MTDIVTLGTGRDPPLALMRHDNKLTLMFSRRLGERIGKRGKHYPGELCHVRVSIDEARIFAADLLANEHGRVANNKPLYVNYSSIEYLPGQRMCGFKARWNTLEADDAASRDDVIAFGKAIVAMLRPEPIPQPVPAPVVVKRDVMVLNPSAPPVPEPSNRHNMTLAPIAGQPSWMPAPGPLR